MSDDVALERTMSLSWPIDLRLTWRPLQRGPHDLTTRVWEQQAVRATHTPEGPATLHVHVDGKVPHADGSGLGARKRLGA